MAQKNNNSYYSYSNNLIFPTELSKIAPYLLLTIILLLPLHTQLFYKMLPHFTGLPAIFFSIWKELLFLIVGSIFIFNFFLTSDIPKVTYTDILMIFFVLLLSMLIFLSGDKKIALYGFRVFVEPFAVYCIAKAVKVKFCTLKTFLKYFFYLGVAISIWAIFQAAVLGDDFLMDIGYKNEYGRLSNSFYIAMFPFQRAAGTFSGPNTYGIFVQLVIMIGLFLFHTKSFQNRQLFYISMSVLTVGLVYSFSRSSWIALFFSSIIFTLLRTNIIKSIKLSLKFFLLFSILLTGLFILYGSLIEPVIEHVARTISLEDPSAVGHINSLKDSVEFVAANPLGIGVGMSGPRAIAMTGKYLNSENSFFIVAFDTGLIGVFIYFSCLFSILVNLVLRYRKIVNIEIRLFFIMVISVFIGETISWNFLPYIVELEATILLFFLLGIAQGMDVTVVSVD